MQDISSEDLDAAIAAGVLGPAEAAALGAFARARRGATTAAPAEDEPFHVFRGFAEIFLTVGLLLLFFGASGAMTVAAVGSGYPVAAFIGTRAASATLAWLLAEHFTRTRRMILPSIALATLFACNVAGSAWLLALAVAAGPLASTAMVGATGMLAMWLWFLRFRLPFSTFLLAIFGSILAYATVEQLTGGISPGYPVARLVDFRASPALAATTLAFGFVTFAFAMRADLADPLRQTRCAAIGFWLHLLAAPALVNALVFTLSRIGGAAGSLLTAVALALVAGLALVIDRRSFLTAGLVYLALLVSLAIRSTGQPQASILTILVVGVVVTALGTWWLPLRTALMRALPGRVWKTSLPPF